MPDVLGLDRYMHEAYRVLVRHRHCTAAQVATLLGINRTDAERALERLTSAGLAAPCADNGTALDVADTDGVAVAIERGDDDAVTALSALLAGDSTDSDTADDRPVPALPVRRPVRALDPVRSLGPLLAQRQARLTAQQQELARAKDVVAALAATFSEQGGRTGKADLSRGNAAVRARIEDMVAGASASVACLVDEQTQAVALGIRAEVVAQALGRGVAVRVLYPRATLTDPRFVAQSRWLSGLGGRVRTSRSLPPPMLVVDGGTSLLPADGRTATALVVHNRTLGRSLGMLFDQAWAEAKMPMPPPKPTGDEPSPAEIDLLALLAKGMTDASAARQLGVSLRTVRRMMADLMSRLGARSRFEAGMRAAERGWVGQGIAVRLGGAAARPGRTAGSLTATTT